jgi:hypothetical protein
MRLSRKMTPDQEQIRLVSSYFTGSQDSLRIASSVDIQAGQGEPQPSGMH